MTYRENAKGEEQIIMSKPWPRWAIACGVLFAGVVVSAAMALVAEWLFRREHGGASLVVAFFAVAFGVASLVVSALALAGDWDPRV